MLHTYYTSRSQTNLVITDQVYDEVCFISGHWMYIQRAFLYRAAFWLSAWYIRYVWHGKIIGHRNLYKQRFHIQYLYVSWWTDVLPTDRIAIISCAIGCSQLAWICNKYIYYTFLGADNERNHQIWRIDCEIIIRKRAASKQDGIYGATFITTSTYGPRSFDKGRSHNYSPNHMAKR
jgi:hypothetical protein